MLNRLLSALRVGVDSSVHFLIQSRGEKFLQRQFHRLSNAGDFAASQAAES
jgi:hypothetical protein